MSSEQEASTPIAALVEKITENPTLDRYLDRHPTTLKFPDDYREIVKVARMQRALYIKGKEDRKAAKRDAE